MPQNILLIGAGKSATALIRHLTKNAAGKDFHLTIADASLSEEAGKSTQNPCCTFLRLDVLNAEHRALAVRNADLVISLMPTHLHVLVAQDCIREGRHLITSSYISPEMKALDEAAKAAGVMLMCEMGLDPGIDHMSAMQTIDGIRERGGTLKSFKSYCGGLVAPESDTNGWHYKFTWNPSNVVIADGGDGASEGGAEYLADGKKVHVPYPKIFAEERPLMVEGLGELAWYPNRDSLEYIGLYGVEGVETFLRATLRYPSFMKGWAAILEMKVADNREEHSYEGWSTARWWGHHLEKRREAGHPEWNEEVRSLLEEIGAKEETLLPLTRGTDGEILLQILMEKWAMQPGDQDMVVMQNELEYTLDGARHHYQETMLVKGNGDAETAMAKTVGFPIAVLAEGISDGSIPIISGVQMPIHKSVYEPVLRGLEALGIGFERKEGKG